MKFWVERITKLSLTVLVIYLFLRPNLIFAHDFGVARPTDCPADHPAQFTEIGWICRHSAGAISDPATLKDLEIIFGNVVTVLLGLAGFALVMMIIVGGFRILFSAGDPKSIEAGRNTLTWAFTGFAMVIIAWFLLLLIEAVTGIDTLHFFRIGPSPTPTPPP